MALTNDQTKTPSPNMSQALTLRSTEPDSTTYTPRPDRGSEINETNAQGQLPPDAAIFVANLSSTSDPNDLTTSLHRIFDVFGRNYISVRRDRRQNHYAVVQFELTSSARSALRTANHTILDGRQIRLEQSKGCRAVIITPLDPGTVTESEARSLLSPYGSIELIMSTSMIPSRPTTPLSGQYVKFAFFLDCQDALRSFPPLNPTYRLQLAPNLEPVRRIGPPNSSIYTAITPPSASSAYPSGNANNTDTKSIYVGNLDTTTTEHDLRLAFSEYGPVENVNYVRKTYPGGGVNCFAFIEYTNPMDAEAAAGAEVFVNGKRLRIEPKEYTARRGQRLAYEERWSQDRSQITTTPPSGGYGYGSQQRRAISPGARQRPPLRLASSASQALVSHLAQNEGPSPQDNNFRGSSPYSGSAFSTGSPPPRNPYGSGGRAATGYGNRGMYGGGGILRSDLADNWRVPQSQALSQMQLQESRLGGEMMGGGGMQGDWRGGQDGGGGLGLGAGIAGNVDRGMHLGRIPQQGHQQPQQMMGMGMDVPMGMMGMQPQMMQGHHSHYQQQQQMGMQGPMMGVDMGTGGGGGGGMQAHSQAYSQMGMPMQMPERQAGQDGMENEPLVIDGHQRRRDLGGEEQQQQR